MYSIAFSSLSLSIFCVCYDLPHGPFEITITMLNDRTLFAVILNGTY